MVIRDHLIEGGLSLLPQRSDVRVLVHPSHQVGQVFQRSHVGRYLIRGEADFEVGRPVRRKRERNVLAQRRPGIRLVVNQKELVQLLYGGQRLLRCQLLAHVFAQRVFGGGVGANIVSGGVDGRQNREDRFTGVELALF